MCVKSNSQVAAIFFYPTSLMQGISIMMMMNMWQRGKQDSS